jgi:glutathione S-transferase
VHFLKDVESVYLSAMDQPLADKEAGIKWLDEVKMPAQAARLDAILGDKRYFFGDKPSVADFALVGHFVCDPVYYSGFTASCGAFKRIQANLYAEPALAKYLAARDLYEATPAFQKVMAWYGGIVEELAKTKTLQVHYLPTTLPTYDSVEEADAANAVLLAGPQAFYPAL